VGITSWFKVFFSSCFWFFFLFFFFHYFKRNIIIIILNVIKALPSLAFGPPLSSCSDLVFQMVRDPFGVSLSLGGRGGALCDIPYSNCGVLFSLHGLARHQKHC